MHILVVSHKPLWRSSSSPIGYATDGGFVYHIQAISSVATKISLVVPQYANNNTAGEIPFQDTSIKVSGIPSFFWSGKWRQIEVILQLPFLIPYLIWQMARADAVHLPVPGDYGAVALWLSRFFSKKLIWVRHCADFKKPKSFIQRWFVREMVRRAGGNVVCFATGGAESLPSAKNGNIRWIFSSSLLKSELQAMCKPRSLPSSNEDIHLITVSRQTIEKGTGRLLQALPAILGIYPNVQLHVVGDGADLPLFKNQATELGLNNVVHFYGKLNSKDVYNALAKAHLFVYPTLASEGFPKVVLEALGSGLPVITNPISVLPTLIANTRSGIVMQKGDKAELVHAVCSVLGNKELYEEFAKNACLTAGQYSLEDWVDQMALEIKRQTGRQLNKMHEIIK